MTDSTTWPELPVDSWSDTRTTLHLWLQVVGKIEMSTTPLVNHWWNVSFSISARGLRTGLMRSARGAFDAEFDLVEHRLVLRDTDGRDEQIALEPMSVAEFWSRTRDALGRLDIECDIVPVPNEVSPAVPFAEDTEQRPYDATAVTAFWRQLVSMERAFSLWRAGFAGKVSPVHLFWGSLDLSCARFSGRVAPPHTGEVPNCPPFVMLEAESRENAAAGFWPGGAGGGMFYAYAYPEPEGYRDATLSAGAFDAGQGEWLLPYDDVRSSPDPDATLLTFLEETYRLAADHGHWDRDLLEVDPHRLDQHHHPSGRPAS